MHSSNKKTVSREFAIVATGIVFLIIILVLTVFARPCNTVHVTKRELPRETFCGQCGWGTGSLSPTLPPTTTTTTTTDKKDCPSLGSYAFQPCKCFGAQGGALNPPRPFDAPSCSGADSMSKDDMIKTQIGCLRNTFSFPDVTLSGVS